MKKKARVDTPVVLLALPLIVITRYGVDEESLVLSSIV